MESDHPYENNFEDAWPITKLDATQIRIHFTKLDLNTISDELIILDENGKQLEKYNKYNAEDIWTEWFTGNTLIIKLKTDGDGTGYGFKIDQIETRTNMAPSTDLPESFHPYANNFEYSWPPIIVPDKTQIRIHFSELGLADSLDEILIFDKNNRILKKYDSVWGGIFLEDEWTEWFTGNTITIKLITNNGRTGYGFKIDQIETRTNMTPSTDLPESDHPYANNFVYTWPSMTVPGATQIRICFEKLYLEDGDKLILLDKNGNQLEKYYRSFITVHNDYYWTEWFTGDTLQIRLQTDKAGNDYGFKIHEIETRGATTSEIQINQPTQTDVQSTPAVTYTPTKTPVQSQYTPTYSTPSYTPPKTQQESSNNWAKTALVTIILGIIGGVMANRIFELDFDLKFLNLIKKFLKL